MYKTLFVMVLIGISLCCTGCIIPVLSTENTHEMKVDAEYSIPNHLGKESKILVLVNQPSWLNMNVNARKELTGKFNAYLTVVMGLERSQIIEYSQISDIRKAQGGFGSKKTAEIGQLFGADLVLDCLIDDYQLYEMGEKGYYNGKLFSTSRLYDVKTGQKLWPIEDIKTAKARVSVHKGDPDGMLRRLATASAHCTLRYLYDCPYRSFTIQDEVPEIDELQGWE